MEDRRASAAPGEALADQETEFIARAQQFLIGLGVNPAKLDPDADLVETGVLDSLLVLTFLAFVEEQRGPEAQLQHEDIIAIRKLRTASKLVCSGKPLSRKA